ncbi:MAG TPA: PQQ-binding-like beta-propeller repeat protein, partial [Pirellulales bacterium]|nr:PQQ-binding-like beta-propeller repeat protein [Pirellulales bacterium]
NGPGASSSAAPAARAHSWHVPLAILLGGAALITGCVLWPDVEGGHRSLATVSACVLTFLLFMGWVWFYSGFHLVVRIGSFLVVVVVCVLFRLEGYSGDLHPKFTWRFKSKKDVALADKLSASSDRSESQPIDLAKTTKDDFPQFLGPHRDAKIAGVRLARDWSQIPRCLWRQPIGAGWSGFAVVGEFAVTQEQRGEEELVVCYELLTGKVRWSHADHVRFTSVMGGDGPRSTPTIHEGRVYTLGATGLLNCLDGANGKLLWSHDIVKENEAAPLMWGHSCSPLVVDDGIVVSSGGLDHNSLVSYHKDTGALLWHGGSSPASYASPVLATLSGQRQIIMVNSNDVMGHDPATGKIVWHFDWPGDQPKVPQPIVVGSDRVLISAGYGLGCQMLKVLPNRNREESIEKLWSSRALKPKFMNPIAHEGFVYGIDDGAALTCLDLETGKRQWRGGRYGHGQMLLVGDLLLLQSEAGEMLLIEASPSTHRELGRFQAVGEKAWNTPALSGRHLLVRNHEEAACYELPLAE